MREVDVFHIGPQKAATTWIYRCFREHPAVACPPTGAIHYYDIFYAKGEDWYARHFKAARSNQLTFDPTFTYIRSPWAPRRIAADNPDAKIICFLRNPVDRAFSHYWHEKKKGKITFEFGEVLENYDLFSSWIEPGFYAEHLERYLKHFSRDQLLCLPFRLLKRDDEEFLRRILTFIDVDPSFQPSWLGEKANEAGGRRTFTNAAWRRVRRRLERVGQGELVESVENAPVVGRWVRDRDEYEEGMDEAVRRELLEICEPEVRRIERLLSLNLEHWLQ
jgi:DNA-binding transcriptional ArsR family regulator